MDGGRRLLRSLGGPGAALARLLLASTNRTSSYAFAGAFASNAFAAATEAAPRLPGRRRRRRAGLLSRTFDRAAHSRFIGTTLVLTLLTGAACYGAVRGGAYAQFVAANGTIPDIIARLSGFPIQAVTITGAHELAENEVLGLAGVGPRNSLIFLDVAATRAKLKAVPLIREASVSKLFPNRLLIEIEERQPYALWQRNGQVSVVDVDGTPIDDLRNLRYTRLPLVVGDGANGKLSDYLAILDASGELRDRIRAGIYVSGRRWTLKMENGVAVDLPETDPAAALSRFALLEHDGHILEKDILSVDLRIPGRVTARLTEDAGAARAAALASKSKKKGATT